LNSIGFDWGKTRPIGWNSCNRQQLEEQKPTHGLCDVPERCSGKKLVTAEERFGVLEKERGAHQLNTNNGILCNRPTTDNENWDVHFRELLAYLQTHADCNVPQGDPRNPLLTRWVSEQRNDYDLQRRGEQTSLTPLREAKLDAIGFTWFVRGTAENAPADGVCCAVKREEIKSESKVRSENIGVASPDHITSG
jgi:hypothetical protein